MSWVEVGAGAFCRRYDPWDVNVGVVRGADGLCVIDSRGSHRQASALLDDLRAIGGPVRAVVNTHWHFDHTWGNGVFGALGSDIWGHSSLPSTMEAGFHDVRESLQAADPERAEELDEVVCHPPHRLLDAVATVDLGDRSAEVRHLGRGHTDGDVVVACAEAGTLFAGDLVEQAGPPAYGDDSHPLSWPATMEALLELVGSGSAVVPGHGTPVDRGFCRDQAAGITAVAELCRELHAEGVLLRDAIAAGGDRWPFPADRLREAVLRAWTELDATT